MSGEPENLILEHLRAIRAEIAAANRKLDGVSKTLHAETQDLSIATLERFRRLERRLDEHRDDIEAMLKAEIAGSGLHWRREFEARLEALEGKP